MKEKDYNYSRCPNCGKYFSNTGVDIKFSAPMNAIIIIQHALYAATTSQHHEQRINYTALKPAVLIQGPWIIREGHSGLTQ